MWSNLPSHLRTGLGAALLLVIGVAVASFTLSFIALREVASNPAFGWGRNAWIFPACVDMALVACEVVYVSVSMIRGVNPALPFSLMVLFGAATVWFNVERVPAQWRMVTAIPPLAGIFMTLLIAYLFKVFARITGKAWHHEAPPLAYGTLGVPGSPIQGPSGGPTRSRTRRQLRRRRRGVRTGISAAPQRRQTGIPADSWRAPAATPGPSGP